MCFMNTNSRHTNTDKNTNNSRSFVIVTIADTVTVR